MAAYSRNLGGIYSRVAVEDCRMVVVGDSIWAKSAQPRMTGGVMRTWPVHFNGRVGLLKSAASSDGVAGATAIIDGITFNTPDPGEVWDDGSQFINPNEGSEFIFTGDVIAQQPYLQFRVTELTSYVKGDWTQTSALKGRLIFWRNPAGATYYLVASRGGSESTPTNRYAAGAAGYASDEIAFPGSSGSNPLVLVRTAGGVTDTGSRMMALGSLIYRDDRPGLQLDAIATGGYATTDHLDPTEDGDGKYTDAALQGYLHHTREPNLLMFQLGQNAADGEQSGNGTTDLYQDHMEAVVTRYLACTAANGTDDPRVVLVAPYQGGSHPGRYADMAEMLDELARDQGWGFINLFRLVNDTFGDYAEWQGVLTSDGTHPTTAGADAFARLIWQEIRRTQSTRTIVLGVSE